MTNLAKRIFYKELVSYRKRSSTYLSPIVFFLITIALYPLALSNDPADLSFLAPGITWICVLLSTLLSIQNIFNEDFEDGSLDIFFSLRVSTLPLVILKILVNWIFSSLPIIILSSTVVFLLFLPSEGLVILLTSLLIGTPVISLFGALAGALSLGKSSILGPAIVLPLSLPILILGTSAVNGAAVGIGATMLLPMDTRICSDRARFGFVFARRGIVPEAASSWFLPRLIGIDKALELCYTGKVISAEEAKEINLVSEVLPQEKLIERALEIAKEFTAESSQISIALTRQMMWRMLGADDPMEAHKVDSRAIFELGQSGEAVEGVTSFLEKRSPSFPGKVSKDMPSFFPWWNEKEFE